MSRITCWLKSSALSRVATFLRSVQPELIDCQPSLAQRAVRLQDASTGSEVLIAQGLTERGQAAAACADGAWCIHLAIRKSSDAFAGTSAFFSSQPR